MSSLITAADLKAKLAALKAVRDNRGVVEAEVAPTSTAPSQQAFLTEENSTHLQTIQKIADLQAALTEESPQFPYLLKEIHMTLRSYPDTVHLLSNEQRAIIVQGCFKHSGVVIVTANRRSGKSSDGTKKLKDVNVTDI